jgi:cell wall assembly regulator SMI1
MDMKKLDEWLAQQYGTTNRSIFSQMFNGRGMNSGSFVPPAWAFPGTSQHGQGIAIDLEHERHLRYHDEALGAWHAYGDYTESATSPGSLASQLANLDAVAAGSLRSNNSLQSERAVASPTRLTDTMMRTRAFSPVDRVVWSPRSMPTSMDSPVVRPFRSTRTPCRLAVKRLWPSSPSSQG